MNVDLIEYQPLLAMVVLGVLGSPCFVAAAVAAQTGIFHGDKTFGKGWFFPLFFDFFEHISICIGVDFENMGAYITRIAGDADCRLACFGHMALETAGPLVAVNGFRIALGNVFMAFITGVADEYGPLVWIVTVNTAHVFVSTFLEFIDLLIY